MQPRLQKGECSGPPAGRTAQSLSLSGFFGMAAGHGELRIAAQAHRPAGLPGQGIKPAGMGVEHRDDGGTGGDA